jgi:hypothetical protein
MLKQMGGQLVCTAVDFAFTDPKIADIRADRKKW